MTHRVILGATRCHAVDELATAAAANAELQSCLDTIHAHWYEPGAKTDAEDVEAAAARGRALLGKPDLGLWRLMDFRRSARGWHEGLAVPRCRMVGAGVPMTLEQAERRGFPLSRECAKAVGLFDDGRNPLARVTWRGSRRAYQHVLDCETCWQEGVGACELFSRIALEEIDSDLDPRLDPDHLAELEGATT